MKYNVKISVEFPLDPVTKYAGANTLYGREQDIVDALRPALDLEYDKMAMLKAADAYVYSGMNELFWEDEQSAEHAYETIRGVVAKKYPNANVKVTFTPQVPTFSFP